MDAESHCSELGAGSLGSEMGAGSLGSEIGAVTWHRDVAGHLAQNLGRGTKSYVTNLFKEIASFYDGAITIIVVVTCCDMFCIPSDI